MKSFTPSRTTSDAAALTAARKRRLAVKIGACVAAAAGCLFFILFVSGTLRQVSTELPKYGFFSIRELHILVREVGVLGDAVTSARVAPDAPESLDRLLEANDLAYIRFVRLDRSGTIERFPEFEELIESVTHQIGIIDDLLAKGLPFDPEALQPVEDGLEYIETRMNDSYYAFGEETNLELLKLQDVIDILGWQVIASLFALSVLSIGSALLLVNRHEVLGTVKYLASHDQTSGVLNRNWMSLNGDEILKQARKRNQHVEIGLIDLDHFKEVNDAFGHHVGDEVLAIVGKTLTDMANRPDVVVFRVGGDEFAICATCGKDEETDELFSALSDKLNRHLKVGAHRLQVGASIGIARYPKDGNDVENLLKHADYAVYSAKKKGRGQIARFSEEILEEVRTRSELGKRLKTALASEELFLVWQPQFKLATGQVTGVEALLRWRDEESGELVPPSEFVSIAERSDMILDLDRYVMKMACAEAVKLRKLSPDFTFSVNLSGKSFQDPGLPAYVADVLEKYGLPPHCLEIEITESVFISNRVTAERVFTGLIELGIKFAVDDFGTGYSNLASLAALPLDRVKIDRSFIFDLEKSPKKQKLVLSILALARSLGIEAVAEGVETEEQMNFLIENDCQFAQGFLLSHPLEMKCLAAYLKQMAKSPNNPGEAIGLTA